MKCQNCKVELGQEMIEANMCWECGEIIDLQKLENDYVEEISEPVIHSKQEETTYADRSEKNMYASMGKKIGAFILVLGTIGSIILGSYGRDFSFGTFLIYEFVVLVAGAFFMMIAEIVQLLEDIKNK